MRKLFYIFKAFVLFLLWTYIMWVCFSEAAVSTEVDKIKLIVTIIVLGLFGGWATILILTINPEK